MGNQYETLIPSRLNYITLPFRQTNNSQFKPIIGFNASIYDNRIDYLGVSIVHLFDNNWTEFKELIHKIDKAYSEVG